MNTLLNILQTNDRIPVDYRKTKNKKEIETDVDEIISSGLKITNSHVFNLISLLYPKSKKVVKVEYAGINHTLDLEIDDHSHSYYANGTPTHNTCNIPHDYPFEKFKDLYLNVYGTGFIKGFTSYRAGTMTSVLAAVDEKTATNDDEEIILDDVKLPDSSPATMKTLRGDSKKWYLTVIWNDTMTRPFALFVQTNHHEKNVIALDAVDRLSALAVRKGIPQQFIDEVHLKIAGNDNASKIARMISLNLRHGVLIKNIVAELDKIEEAYVGSFLFTIKKFLSSFIKDGEKIEGVKCSECGGSNVVFQEGCSVCRDCGSSKCG